MPKPKTQLATFPLRLTPGVHLVWVGSTGRRVSAQLPPDTLDPKVSIEDATVRALQPALAQLRARAQGED